MLTKVSHGLCLVSVLWLSFLRRSIAFTPSNRLSTRPLAYVTRSASSSISMNSGWSPLDPESFVSAKCLIEQTLCISSDQGPQLAKNVDYATAILDAWCEEEQKWEQDQDQLADTEPFLQRRRIEYKRVSYQDLEGTLLHGYIVRPRPQSEARKEASSACAPGVVFFHTAAGPHDLFLLWKAASLISNRQLASLGCQVFIADLLGDESGWAWDSDDRSRYIAVRDYLLKEHCSGADHSFYRPVLQQRIQAAIDCLAAQDGVNSSRLGALGWCFGGQAILELGQMRLANMLALASFHGVFEGATASSLSNEAIVQNNADTGHVAEVLLCHGVDDLFVSNEQLETAMTIFQQKRHRLSLLQLPAKHGFTNPAQAFNDNPSFGYNQQAAGKAWGQTVALLARNLR